MMWLPTGRVLMLQAAWLLALPDPRAAVQIVVAPSMNATVPAPTPGLANAEVTVVLSVIIWPAVLGLSSLPAVAAVVDAGLTTWLSVAAAVLFWKLPPDA